MTGTSQGGNAAGVRRGAGARRRGGRRGGRRGLRARPPRPAPLASAAPPGTHFPADTGWAAPVPAASRAHSACRLEGGVRGRTSVFLRPALCDLTLTVVGPWKAGRELFIH